MLSKFEIQKFELQISYFLKYIFKDSIILLWIWMDGLNEPFLKTPQTIKFIEKPRSFPGKVCGNSDKDRQLKMHIMIIYNIEIPKSKF